MTREHECAIEAAAFLEKASLVASPYYGASTVERVERAMELLVAAKSRLDEAARLRAERLANEAPAGNDPGEDGWP